MNRVIKILHLHRISYIHWVGLRENLLVKTHGFPVKIFPNKPIQFHTSSPFFSINPQVFKNRWLGSEGSGAPGRQECGTKLDHGVLVVGYGTENGVDYWKARSPAWRAMGLLVNNILKYSYKL